MTPSNQEIIHRAFRSFERLDLDGFTADWHPDVVWDVSHYEGWTGEKTRYEGTAEVLAGFADYLGSARSVQISGLEVARVDDHRVLGLHLEERDRVAAIEIGAIYELHDQKVTRVDVFTGHAAARTAAAA
jgi:ketosteroid isomerase-like protein